MGRLRNKQRWIWNKILYNVIRWKRWIQWCKKSMLSVMHMWRMKKEKRKEEIRKMENRKVESYCSILDIVKGGSSRRSDIDHSAMNTNWNHAHISSTRNASLCIRHQSNLPSNLLITILDGSRGWKRRENNTCREFCKYSKDSESWDP